MSLFAVMALMATFVACEKMDIDEPIEDANKIEIDKESDIEILSFNSRESLEQAIQKGLNYDSFYKRLAVNAVTSEIRQTLRSANVEGNEKIEIAFEDLVPEENFAQLLNKDGEIIVNDTLYRINIDGTFYAHKGFTEELRNAVKNYELNEEVIIGADLYKIGANVYRFDTYKNADFSDYYSDLEDETDESGFRSTAAQSLHVKQLPVADGLKFTIVGKFFQGKGVRKSNTVVFPKEKNKRLNCAVFEYNNVARQSTGITAKIQKRIGWPIKYWAKVKYWDASNIVIGYEDIVIKCDQPASFPNFNEELNKMRSLGKQSYPLEKLRTQLPFPDWMKESIFVNISLPLLVDEEYEIPVKDLIAIAKPKIVELGNEVNRRNRPPFAQPENLTYEQILRKYSLGVPLYTKDAIYLVFPRAAIYNKQDETEIKKRFSYDFIREFVIGYSTDPYNPSFNWKNIKVDYKGAPNARILGGDCFAAGYHQGDWVGYRLTTR